MLVQGYRYKRWADDRTLDAVRHIDNTTHADSYAFVLQQINHMTIVQELFKSRLLGEEAPHSSTNTDVVPNLTELSRRLGSSNDWYSNYVAALDQGNQKISFVFADGKRGAMTVDEILFHVLTHGSYHRGNIAHALDLAGVSHPVDGYGIYIHEVEPERRGA